MTAQPATQKPTQRRPFWHAMLCAETCDEIEDAARRIREAVSRG